MNGQARAIQFLAVAKSQIGLVLENDKGDGRGGFVEDFKRLANGAFCSD